MRDGTGATASRWVVYEAAPLLLLATRHRSWSEQPTIGDLIGCVQPVLSHTPAERDEGRGVGSTGSCPVYRRGISRRTTRLGASFCRGPSQPMADSSPLADLCPAHQTKSPHCLRCIYNECAEAIPRPGPLPSASDVRRDIHAPRSEPDRQIAEPTGSRRNDAPTVGPAPPWPMGAPQLASQGPSESPLAPPALLLRFPGSSMPRASYLRDSRAPGYASEPLARI